MARMPHGVKPMLARLVDEPFDRKGWIFEIKWDGYRAIAEIKNLKFKIKNSVQLYSRNLISFNSAYAEVVKDLSKIKHDLVLDGEVVAFQGKRADFQTLQQYHKTGKGTVIYQVFDILYLDGKDLSGLPLIERKKILKKVLPKLTHIKYSDHVVEKGEKFFALAEKSGLEGIIAKDGASPYRAGKRTGEWLKIKTHKRQEAVIAGFTAPRGSRKRLGALILGVYEGGSLVYIGHTGTGFNSQSIEDIYAKLEPLIQKSSPFKKVPKTNQPATWVKPVLVAEVKFQEWTEDGQMRQPVYLGLRTDKKAMEVKKEVELPSEPTEDKPKLTHLDKVYFPKDKLTKGDVIEYYQKIAPTILPYLKDRPENLHRHPSGIKGASFYQKDFDIAPDWVETIDVYSESNKEDITYVIAQDENSLLYLANLGCIEFNPWLSRTKKLDYPDFVLFDLDPEGIGFAAVVEAALTIKKVLDDMRVPSYPKTSGKTGLHICVPTGAKYTYDQTKTFSEIVVRIVNAKLPKITSVERMPGKRQGKVYLDYLQNRIGQTMAAPYSLRPADGAPVSTPLKWSEVRKGLDPKDFNIKTIFKRLEKVGDLWAPVLGKGIDLKNVIGRGS